MVSIHWLVGNRERYRGYRPEKAAANGRSACFLTLRWWWLFMALLAFSILKDLCATSSARMASLSDFLAAFLKIAFVEMVFLPL